MKVIGGWWALLLAGCIQTPDIRTVGDHVFLATGSSHRNCPMGALHLKVMRDLDHLVRMLEKTLIAAKAGEEVADALPVDDQVAFIGSRTTAQSPYARAARAQLRSLGMSELIEAQEELDG